MRLGTAPKQIAPQKRRFASPAPAEIVIDESKPGTPVKIEFGRVLDCADLHGIPFVWVNDPDELFPSFAR